MSVDAVDVALLWWNYRGWTTLLYMVLSGCFIQVTLAALLGLPVQRRDFEYDIVIDARQGGLCTSGTIDLL